MRSSNEILVLAHYFSAFSVDEAKKYDKHNDDRPRLDAEEANKWSLDTSKAMKSKIIQRLREND